MLHLPKSQFDDWKRHFFRYMEDHGPKFLHKLHPFAKTKNSKGVPRETYFHEITKRLTFCPSSKANHYENVANRISKVERVLVPSSMIYPSERSQATNTAKKCKTGCSCFQKTTNIHINRLTARKYICVCRNICLSFIKKNLSKSLNQGLVFIELVSDASTQVQTKSSARLTIN